MARRGRSSRMDMGEKLELIRAVITMISTTLGVIGSCVAAYESSDEKERKPDLIDKVMDRSLKECDLQKRFVTEESYDERLKSTLSQIKSVQLDHILASEITICLDRRLHNLDRLPNRGQLYTMYYLSLIHI